jgi:lysophospholipid acyltransferase (LPLAT)-like uncharacterized protein
MAHDPRRERRITWIVRFGVLLIRLLGSTWRFRVSHDGAYRKLRAEKQPIVFMLWHGEILPLIYLHRHEQVAMLVSEHTDGEIIARISRALGFQTVRGSTSRGAARALLALTRTLGEGHDLAITPDGPRGPAKSIAPGSAIVAYRAKAPMIGAAVSVKSAWRFKSWDSFLIPWPFARVDIAYSDAAWSTAADAREAAGDIDQLRQLMDSAEARIRG